MRTSTQLKKPSSLNAFPRKKVGRYLASLFVSASRDSGEDDIETVEFLEVIVRRGIEHMSADLADRHTLESVSEAARCGPFSLIRAFRRLTGTTPIRFLTILRLAEAKRLLLMGDARVIEACYEVGYESLGSFNNRFKALVGLTPTELRRKLHTLDIDQHLSQKSGAWQDGFICAVAVYRAGAAHSDLIRLFPLGGASWRPLEPRDYEVIYYALPWSGDSLDLLLQRRVLRSDCVPLIDDSWRSACLPSVPLLRPPTRFDPPVLPVIVECLERRSLPVALRALP